MAAKRVPGGVAVFITAFSSKMLLHFSIDVTLKHFCFSFDPGFRATRRECVDVTFAKKRGANHNVCGAVGQLRNVRR